MNLSLKSRLALGVALGTALLAGSAGYGIWSIARQGAQERTDAMLRAPGRRLTERTGWNTDWERFDQSLSLVFGENWSEEGICRVVGNGAGHPVYYESSNWPEDLMVQHPAGQGMPAEPEPREDGMFQVRDPLLYTTATVGGKSWRMVNLANPELTMHLGVNVEAQREQSRRLGRRLFLAGGVLTTILYGLTWMIAHRALSPVATIARTAEEITARRLDQRIDLPERYDVEFAQLMTVFNDMIDRLERSFLQSSRFSADASHELKTPITNLFAEVTARLNQCEDDSEEQRFLAGMVHELDQIRSVLGGLLLLSRADSGLLELSLERMDLGDLLREVGEDGAVLAEQVGLQYTGETRKDGESANLWILGDRVMLAQAFHNLLRNAVQYNAPGGFVRLESGCEERGWIIVRIVNSGTAIPEDLQPRLFERFRKGEQGGHGLGLNIVREIVAAHGGTVELETSTEEETAFAIRFPAAEG